MELILEDGVVSSPYAHFQRGDLRQSFIDGARVMLREREHDQFSLSELARQIGVSPASAYRHFEDKSALLGAVAEVGYRQLREVLSLDPRPANPGEWVTVLGVRYVEFAEENPELYKTMFRGSTASTSATWELGILAFQPLVEAVRQAQSSAQLPAGAPATIAGAMWSSLHGIVELHRSGGLKALGLDDEPAKLVHTNFQTMFPKLNPNGSG